jgi:hypothetical protein
MKVAPILFSGMLATSLALPAFANDAAVATPLPQFTAADTQMLFEQDAKPMQFAALSQQEMKETEGSWIPFAFYYYGPAIAGGVSWMATSGWRTIPGVWHNTRQRFSR